MSSTTSASGSVAYSAVTVTAQPDRITAGGIVLLTAEPRPGKGTFDVEWTVRGARAAVGARHPHRAARHHHRHRRTR